MPAFSGALQPFRRKYRQSPFRPKGNPAFSVDSKPTSMAEDRIREMAGDGADVEERTPKVPDADVRNGTRQPVNS
jgi:hypothetical protein